MFDLKKNAVKLAEVLAALLILWFMVEFGIGEPFHEDELLGMTQQQVRARYGEPDLTKKPPPAVTSNGSITPASSSERSATSDPTMARWSMSTRVPPQK